MNGLLRTLIKPYWDDDPKRSEILDAANLLQEGEFQLVQLAYKDWYREELPENKNECGNKLDSFISNLYINKNIEKIILDYIETYNEEEYLKERELEKK